MLLQWKLSLVKTQNLYRQIPEAGKHVLARHLGDGAHDDTWFPLLDKHLNLV